MPEPKTVTVRYKRLETTRPLCHVEAGVEIAFSTPEFFSDAFNKAISEHMRVARDTVDNEISKEVIAVMARRDEEEDFDADDTSDSHTSATPSPQVNP